MDITKVSDTELREMFENEADYMITYLAEVFSVSTATIKKQLISRGIIKNSLSEDIKRLLDDGLTQKEVAKKLGIATATVTKYAPYKRPCYLNKEKSENAARLRKWRDKNK